MLTFKEFVSESEQYSPYAKALASLKPHVSAENHEKAAKMFGDMHRGEDEAESFQKHDFGSQKDIVKKHLEKHNIATE